MKTRKVISFFTAAVMAVSALPILSVSAEENTYALGDVDMDGYITGHDAAMVSRYVLDDSYTLTEEQLALADVNADGAVNQADADWIFEKKSYLLGDILKNGKMDPMAACIAINIYAYSCLNISPKIVEKPVFEFPQMKRYSLSNWSDGNPDISICEADSTEDRMLDPVEDAEFYEEMCRILLFDYHNSYITPMEFNLLDVDADGTVTLDDYLYLACMYGEESVERDIVTLYFGDGKYYVDRDSIGSRVQFGE